VSFVSTWSPGKIFHGGFLNPAWMCLCCSRWWFQVKLPLACYWSVVTFKKALGEQRHAAHLNWPLSLDCSCPARMFQILALITPCWLCKFWGLSWRLWRKLLIYITAGEDLIFNGLAMLPITSWALFNLNWTAFISEPNCAKLTLCCHSSVHTVGAPSVPWTSLQIPKHHDWIYTKQLIWRITYFKCKDCKGPTQYQH
jgi:hypothetical protein